MEYPSQVRLWEFVSGWCGGVIHQTAISLGEPEAVSSGRCLECHKDAFYAVLESG